MNEEIEKVDERKLEMFVFARNSEDMRRAQAKVVKGMSAKLAEEIERKKDLETNLELAKKNKWRTETLKRHVSYAEKKVTFYTKVVEVLKAGYQIVPDMDIDVFAVRTSKKKPKANTITGRPSYGGPSLNEQKSDHSEGGKGRYVSPSTGVFDDNTYEVIEKDGSKTPKMVRWWSEFGEVEFPFQLVKPQVMDLTSEAMKLKLFDEVGTLPRRAGTDPMVVGRVTLAGTPVWNRKSINFIVAWFLDLNDI